MNPAVPVFTVKQPEKTGAAGATCRFRRQAMATYFEIFCIHPNATYAEQAADAAFDLIEQMEGELSQFRPSSDIGRINRLSSGQTTVIGAATMDCLLLAQHFYRVTDGAFDVSLGSGLTNLELLPEERTVCLHSDEVALDLGGIGKGYAVDRIGEILEEWEITQALIHAGFSSVLALDPPAGMEGWPLTFSTPPGAGGLAQGTVLQRVLARREAWSASGIRKKDHILDPHTQMPVRNRPAVWVYGPLSALAAACRLAQPEDSSAEGTTNPVPDHSPCAAAEAFSTAFMVLSREEIAACCRANPGVQAWLLSPEEEDPEAPSTLLHFA